MICKTHLHKLSLLVIILAFVACSSEKKVAKKIDGIWTVTSFQGRQDSLETDFFEFIGPLFETATINFGDYDISESEGIYEITIIDATNGASDKDAGTYSLNEEGDRLTLIGLEDIHEFDLDVGQDKLHMEGMYFGSSVLIDAELR